MNDTINGTGGEGGSGVQKRAPAPLPDVVGANKAHTSVITGHSQWED